MFIASMLPGSSDHTERFAASVPHSPALLDLLVLARLVPFDSSAFQPSLKQQLSKDKLILLETKENIYISSGGGRVVSHCHNMLHVKKPLLHLWLLNQPS